MKRGFLFLAALVMSLCCTAGYAKIDVSDAFVPDDLVLGGGLQTLKDSFYKTTDRQQQTIIVKMITKNTEPARFDVLMDIVTFDLRMADKYGQAFSTAPEARLIALNYIAEKKDPKYSETMVSIINFEREVEIRIAAARAIGMIGTSESVKSLVNMVRYNFNYPNFREDNDKMFKDDRVVEGICKAFGEIGDPLAFPALLEVVTKQNHRIQTIDAAWDAMNKLKW